MSEKRGPQNGSNLRTREVINKLVDGLNGKNNKGPKHERQVGVCGGPYVDSESCGVLGQNKIH